MDWARLTAGRQRPLNMRGKIPNARRSARGTARLASAPPICGSRQAGRCSLFEHRGRSELAAGMKQILLSGRELATVLSARDEGSEFPINYPDRWA